MRGILVLLMAGFFFGACESPTAFERDSEHDPKNEAFTPDLPTGITVRRQGNTVLITWEDNSVSEDGYLVEKVNDDTVGFAELERLPANTTSYEDVVDFQTFRSTYRVSAFVLRSGAVQRKDTRAVTIDFARPFEIEAEIFDEQRTEIVWKDTTAFTQGFEIERKVGEGDFVTVAALTAQEVATDEPEVFRYVDAFLLPAREPVFHRVRAAQGASRTSSYATTSYPQKLFIGQPELLFVSTLSPTSLVLHWRPRRPTHAAGFIVERSAGGFETFVELGRVAVEVTEFQDDTVQPGQQYTYQVRSLASDPSEPFAVVYQEAMEPVFVASADGNVRSLAFSPDGSMAVTGTHKGTVEWWEIATGARVRHLEETHRGGVVGLAFHPTEDVLATITNFHVDGDVKVWNLSDGTLRYTVDLPSNGVDLLFSDDGTVLFAALEFAVHKIDLASGEVQGIYDPERRVRTFDISPDGATLAVAGFEYGIKLYEVDSGDVIATMNAARQVYEVEFSPDGNLLATRSGEGLTDYVAVRDARTGAPRHEFDGEDATALAFSPDGSVLAIGRGEGTVELMDLNSGALQLTLLLHDAVVEDLIYNRQGELLTGSWDNTAALWRNAQQWVVVN